MSASSGPRDADAARGPIGLEINTRHGARLGVTGAVSGSRGPALDVPGADHVSRAAVGVAGSEAGVGIRREDRVADEEWNAPGWLVSTAERPTTSFAVLRRPLMVLRQRRNHRRYLADRSRLPAA